MKFSLNWIKEYVDIPDNLNDLCDKLDLTGTGVENVEKIGNSLDNVVTAKIIKKTPHPNSDHMFVTLVDVGEKEPLQIVCGAQNFNEGDCIVTAKIGSILPGNFKIKKSKLRGIDSMGMNCSESELGLESQSDGIMILPPNTKVGIPISQYLSNTDAVIDVEVTPNRPDCLSIYGLAREISAIYDTKFKNPLLLDKEKIKNVEIKKVNSVVNINIQDSSRCNRYCGRLIKDVKIGSSPKWLKDKLNLVGCRSINNVVDVSNYILFLYGQPLHTFDANAVTDINGNININVCAAKPNEHFTTLDGIKRVLNPDITVIATDKTVALAGVMGGLDSEVTDNTTSIFLETATFSPAHTSRTSRNLNLISESSMRYERRVDDTDILSISDIATALIVEVAGGYLCSTDGTYKESYVDAWPVKSKPYQLQFRVDKFNNLMGTNLDLNLCKKILSNFECCVKESSPSTLDVKTPTFRPDLEREIDLYEEVLRIYGMDRVESSLPKSQNRVGFTSDRQKTINNINNILCSCGLYETISYSFAQDGDVDILGKDNKLFNFNDGVELLNPMVTQNSFMRQTILPGLLRSVSFNLNHSVEDIKLFESGVVFKSKENSSLPCEINNLCALMCGSTKNSWNKKTHTYNFFDIKGLLELIFKKLKLRKVRFKPIDNNLDTHLVDGCSASIFLAGKFLGWVGQVHPKVLSKFDIDIPVVAFELNLDDLIKNTANIHEFSDIPIYPGVSIDVAFVVDKSVSHEMLKTRISSAGGKLLYSVDLFDVFEDANKLGKDKKQLAFRIEYLDFEKTLTKDIVDKTHDRLIKKVCASTGAEIRN